MDYILQKFERAAMNSSVMILGKVIDAKKTTEIVYEP